MDVEAVDGSDQPDEPETLEVFTLPVRTDRRRELAHDGEDDGLIREEEIVAGVLVSAGAKALPEPVIEGVGVRGPAACPWLIRRDGVSWGDAPPAGRGSSGVALGVFSITEGDIYLMPPVAIAVKRSTSTAL